MKIEKIMIFTVFTPETMGGKVFQKSIKFFLHLDLDVIDYGEFKYDLRKFMGLPP
jgi:hypothetical protein